MKGAVKNKTCCTAADRTCGTAHDTAIPQTHAGEESADAKHRECS